MGDQAITEDKGYEECEHEYAFAFRNPEMEKQWNEWRKKGWLDARLSVINFAMLWMKNADAKINLEEPPGEEELKKILADSRDETAEVLDPGDYVAHHASSKIMCNYWIHGDFLREHYYSLRGG